ncbi:DNA-deoxyinosine glycosylase [Hyphomonas sp.]|jgi:TDG/mug DNA glycosylase family protein|uniref:DNA-deoxyinosine glycosylase n=1 Tax=Hyphomonas sp. TaxID=87 RepID=UPI0039E3D332
MIIQSFAPIADLDASVLVLGSMPGVASLAANQYYAHPRNAFWPIMGHVFESGWDKSYADRTSILKANGIAVWDVLKLCHREGSLDTNIKAEVANDFATFFSTHRNIRRIVLNGGKAAKSFAKYAQPHAPETALVSPVPSTSPAHAAMRFETKCALWQAALVG